MIGIFGSAINIEVPYSGYDLIEFIDFVFPIISKGDEIVNMGFYAVYWSERTGDKKGNKQ